MRQWFEIFANHTKTKYWTSPRSAHINAVRAEREQSNQKHTSVCIGLALCHQVPAPATCLANRGRCYFSCGVHHMNILWLHTVISTFQWVCGLAKYIGKKALRNYFNILQASVQKNKYLVCYCRYDSSGLVNPLEPIHQLSWMLLQGFLSLVS